MAERTPAIRFDVLLISCGIDIYSFVMGIHALAAVSSYSPPIAER
jgi:hypothetical protein